MENIVRKYVDGWNRRDVEGLLSLMHDEAVFHDVFWGETCTRKNMRQYWQDYFAEKVPHEFRVLNMIRVDETQVVTHYEDHRQGDSGNRPTVIHGVEFFRFKDGLVVSIQDHYCDPDPELLRQIANIPSTSLRVRKYAKSGLKATQIAQYKSRLLHLMNEDKLYTDRGLTLGKLAEKVGCSSNDLSQVINAEFGQNLNQFLDVYRIKLVKELLLTERSLEGEFVWELAKL